MRMRKKKHGAERIASCGSIVIKSPDEIPKSGVYLEIGCGKGTFISESAKREPDKSFIGLERGSDVLLLAAEKIKNNGQENVHFIIGDAKNLPEYFEPASVERIYLNFSDPWPKKGYHKRRLTHKNFLEIYKSVLVPNGAIFFKTDNRDLFDFSLEQFAEAGFELKNLTYDLHNSEFNEGNIVTEYEANFSAKGFKINRVEAHLL